MNETIIKYPHLIVFPVWVIGGLIENRQTLDTKGAQSWQGRVVQRFIAMSV